MNGGFCYPRLENWMNLGLRMRTGMTFRSYNKKPEKKPWWKKLLEWLKGEKR